MRNFIGYIGELLVISILKARMYKILKHRFNSPGGEIDLIAQKGERLHFIEVKTSVVSKFIEIPISAKQRNAIIRAAKYFLARNSRFSNCQISFEAYCLSLRRGIIHIKHAWNEC